MQILIFEDATCVLKICMIVAPGFVGNLLWKWIHSAANRNETSSTLLTKSFCVVSLASIVLHHLCHKRKMHKNAREIQQYLLSHSVVYSLQTSPKTIVFILIFALSFTCLIRKKVLTYLNVLFVCLSVCVFRCFVPYNFRTTSSIFYLCMNIMPLKP